MYIAIYLYLFSVPIFIFGRSQARQLVFDPAVVSSLVVNHTADLLAPGGVQLL